MATLLNITNAIADEIGLPRPTSIIGNTDNDARMLLQLSNREGRNLTKAADWTMLTRLHTFSTVSGTAEYALPDDYGRLLRETEWNRTLARPMRGPVSAQEWQVIKSGLIGSGVVNQRMRIIRGSGSTDVARKIYIDPTPDSVETIAFEYMASDFCYKSDASATYSAWNADTDISFIDQDLMALGAIVRFKRAKGLDWGSYADEMMLIIGREKSMDRPAPILNMGYQDDVHLLDWHNMPESGYG